MFSKCHLRMYLEVWKHTILGLSPVALTCDVGRMLVRVGRAGVGVGVKFFLLFDTLKHDHWWHNKQNRAPLLDTFYTTSMCSGYVAMRGR